jgi:hypothetical protein
MSKYLKLSMLIIVLVALNRFSFSQVSTGFTAGVNFSQLTGAHDFNNKVSRKGLYGGILWDISVAYETSLEVGAFYSQQGVIYESEYFNFSSKIIYQVYEKVDYAMVPICWKQTWGDVYTKAGLYGEIALPTSISYYVETIELPDTTKINDNSDNSNVINSFKYNLKDYDIGANFGVGIMTAMSDQFDFFIDVSYKMGFFPVLLNYKPDFVKRNWMFTISTGIILRGKDTRYATKKRR